MGFRFRKSKKIGPLRVNFSKSGVGYSVGGKGFRVTKRADGKTQTTTSLPGTGIAYTSVSGSGSAKGSGGASGKKKGPVASSVLIVLLIVGLAGCMASGGESDEQKTPDKPAASVTESEAAAMTQKEDPEEPEPEAAPEPETAQEPQGSPSDVTQPSKVSTDSPTKETSAEEPQKTAAPVQEPPKAETDAPAQEQPKAETPKPGTETSAPVAATPAPAPAADPQTGMVIGNRNSKKYHEPGCSSVTDMKEKNKVTFDSAAAAQANGYEPCARCH